MNIARLVHPGFWFGRTDMKEAEKWAEMGVGGFCLYWGTPREIERFSQRMRSLSPYPNILISADYEDGLGRWVKGAELLPSNMAIGASRSEDLALKKGLITARQARSIGVDWVLAPVVDLATEHANPIVNTRSFGSDPQLVSKLAAAFMIGLSQGGVLNSLKHFPGHGATSTDSHLAIPRIEKSLDDLLDNDLLPYRNLVRFADSILIGHLDVPAIDKEKISSLSSKTIKDLLIKRFNYKGCIVTDALLMGAIPDQQNAVVSALKAGADILLVPSDPVKAIEDLQELVKKEPQWKSEIISSLSTQEVLISKIVKSEVRSIEHAFHKNTYNSHAAPKCITALGTEVRYKKGTTVHYLDFDGDEPFLTQPFAKYMQENGIHLVPFNNAEVENLLVVSYNGYASFKGHINFTAAQKKQLETALKAANKSVFISFGSPFVHDGFKDKATYSLLAYTKQEDFQEACVQILLGNMKPTGQLPVDIL